MRANVDFNVGRHVDTKHRGNWLHKLYSGTWKQQFPSMYSVMKGKDGISTVTTADSETSRRRVRGKVYIYFYDIKTGVYMCGIHVTNSVSKNCCKNVWLKMCVLQISRANKNLQKSIGRFPQKLAIAKANNVKTTSSKTTQVIII